MNAEEEYLLGAFGDGYIDDKRHELFFHQKNLQWLEYINELLQRNFGINGKISKQDVYILRKKNKELVQRFRALQKNEICDGINFVAGLFDSEGSIYLSTKSKIPVIDITQASKGLESLKLSQKVLDRIGIKSNLNGPYIHKHAKLPQYHLRVYGFANCKMFRKSFSIQHPDKLAKFSALVGTDNL